MYHLLKWLISRLGRRTALASREPVGVSAPGGQVARPQGDDLASPQKPAVPSAGHDAVALSVRNLTKRFGDRVAFQDVSFESATARCSASSARTVPARRRPCGRWAR